MIYERYWPGRLLNLAIDAAHKIHLRAKRPPDPTKWPADAVDADGNRDWLGCSIKFLLAKLHEEVSELEDEAVLCDELMSTFGNRDQFRKALVGVRFEAADVAAVAMMIADRCGAYDALPSPPKIVCLCGSTKFKDAFIEANFNETMAGRIVLSVGFFAHTDREKHGLTIEEKMALDALHKRKIDLADEILVLNIGGYVGDSTRSEIDYAFTHGKKVRYQEPLTTCDGNHAQATPCQDPTCWLL